MISSSYPSYYENVGNLLLLRIANWGYIVLSIGPAPNQGLGSALDPAQSCTCDIGKPVALPVSHFSHLQNKRNELSNANMRQSKLHSDKYIKWEKSFLALTSIIFIHLIHFIK